MQRKYYNIYFQLAKHFTNKKFEYGSMSISATNLILDRQIRKNLLLQILKDVVYIYQTKSEFFLVCLSNFIKNEKFSLYSFLKESDKIDHIYKNFKKVQLNSDYYIKLDLDYLKNKYSNYTFDDILYEYNCQKICFYTIFDIYDKVYNCEVKIESNFELVLSKFKILNDIYETRKGERKNE